MFVLKSSVFPAVVFLVIIYAGFSAKCAADQYRSAEPPSPIDLTRMEAEQELASMLYGKRVVFPPEDPEKLGAAIENGELKVVSYHSDMETGGRLVSETTVGFEGCVLVERFRRPAGIVHEKRINIGFLNTSPPQVETSPVPNNRDPEGIIVSVSFRRDVSERLRKLNVQAGEISDQGYEQFPQDVPARLDWLSQQYDEKLRDKIYFRAGETSHQNGLSVTSPFSGDPYRFHPAREKAEFFIYLLDYYKESFCHDGRTTGQ